MDNGLTLEECKALWEKAWDEMYEFLLTKLAEEDARRADEQAENAA